MSEFSEQESDEYNPSDIPGEYDLAGLLEDVAKGTEEGIREGRIEYKVNPNRMSKGGRLALVDAIPGTKAYIVEVE